jgi:hypothetical protein
LKILVEKYEGKTLLENPGLDEGVTFKWVLKDRKTGGNKC